MKKVALIIGFEQHKVKVEYSSNGKSKHMFTLQNLSFKDSWYDFVSKGILGYIIPMAESPGQTIMGLIMWIFCETRVLHLQGVIVILVLMGRRETIWLFIITHRRDEEGPMRSLVGWDLNWLWKSLSRFTCPWIQSLISPLWDKI